MAFMYPELLHRCVLALTISHIAVVCSLVSSLTITVDKDTYIRPSEISIDHIPKIHLL